jgi:hypothetical protein
MEREAICASVKQYAACVDQPCAIGEGMNIPNMASVMALEFSRVGCIVVLGRKYNRMCRSCAAALTGT